MLKFAHAHVNPIRDGKYAGRYFLVGSVPLAAGYVKTDGTEFTPEDVARLRGASYGPSHPLSPVKCSTVTYDSPSSAFAAVERYGGQPCDLPGCACRKDEEAYDVA